MSDQVRRYSAIGGRGIRNPALTGAAEEFDANVFGAGWVQGVHRFGEYATNPSEPGFNRWTGLEGYEQYADELVTARSRGEQEEMKRRIDRRERDNEILSNSQFNVVTQFGIGLAAGIFDPTNLIPIPAVKGIGIVRGGLKAGAANTAIGAGSEAIRQFTDPTATTDEILPNLTFSGAFGVIGGGISGGWGAGRTAAGMRGFEAALGEVDSPNFSIPLNFADMDMEVRYERIRPNPDGSRPRFQITDEQSGWVIREHDGINYAWEEGTGWVRARDAGRPSPAAVSEDISDALGPPEPRMKRFFTSDDVVVNREFDKGEWHDELASYLPEGDTRPIEDVIGRRQDYHNYRAMEFLWEQRLPREAGESLEDWRARVGKNAMQEFLGSKATGGYAGPKIVARMLERINFSPVQKVANLFPGDNIILDSILRVGGDHGWALQSGELGFAQGPSIYMRGLRHAARFQQFQADLKAEWLKFVTGNQQAVGRTILRENVSAGMYRAKEGVRARLAQFGGGDPVLTFDIFNEMVSKAVFIPGDFQHLGFPVNENIRNAAKSLTRLLEEYDAMLREAGAFKDQKQLLKDKAAWTRQAVRQQHWMNKWLWKLEGETNHPPARIPAVRVMAKTGERIFTGAEHDDAISALIDELGEEGFLLSEKLTPDNFGYMPRPGWTPPTPAQAGPGVAQTQTPPKAGTGPESTTPAAGAAPIAPTVTGAAPAPAPLPPTDELGAAAGERRYAYDPAWADFRSVGEALDHLRRTVSDPDQLDLIARLEPDVRDVALRVVDMEIADLAGDALSGRMKWALASYAPVRHIVTMRGDWGRLPSGTTPDILLHEAIHAATSRRITEGTRDLEAGMPTPYAAAVERLNALHAHIRAQVDVAREQILEGVDEAGRSEFESQLNYMFEGDGHELLTQALTYPEIRDWLKSVPWSGPGSEPRGRLATLWDEFLEIVARLVGYERPTPRQLTAVDEALAVLDQMRDLEQPLMWNETAPGREADPLGALAPQQPGFVTVDQMHSARVASLSEKQLAIYEQRKAGYDMAMTQLQRIDEQLALATELPHRFQDAAGRPENYFSRYWHTSKIATEREKVEYLIARWFMQDGNPAGAEARAAETVSRMIEGDGGAGELGSAGYMNQRALNIPNSFSVSHPKWGEIAVSDYIDLNALAVAEHYVRSAGNRIEAAKMFGDAGLMAEKARLINHVIETYYDKARTDAGRRKVFDKLNAMLRWHDITLRAVYGNLKDSDPWRWDNQTAAIVKDTATLAMMGKNALTSSMDMFRAPMAQGFGTMFRTVFSRMFDDLERTGKGALKMNGLTNEVFDMANSRHTQTMHDIENGRGVVGGSYGWFTKLIHDRIPGFFKITGTTPMTVYFKDLVMTAAQHSAMSDAIRIAKIIEDGRQPGPDDVRRLAALGINPRQAVLLASMPYQTTKNGLILPAIDNWTGPDARAAREALLNAIHAEARRTILTPGIGDHSTVFKGVWFDAAGNKRLESDLMTIPMQFMGYGMAATQKILASAIQGRDRSAVMGFFFMILGGLMVDWLATDSRTWREKSYDQKIFDALERANPGGFFFGDLNKIVERMTGNALGMRAMLGQKSFSEEQGQLERLLKLTGAGPSMYYDLSRVFWDDSLSGSKRRAFLLKTMPYNNVYWWQRFLRDASGELAEPFGDPRR